MQNAANLRVTEQATIVAKAVYAHTSKFPLSERYGLASQMRRAAVSIGSNISEGCGRQGDKELAQFLRIAYGSASELQFQVALSTELDFLTAEQSTELMTEVTRAKKMMSRLIQALRNS